jgi:CO/xanthine dehydrogenase Mo-binding subunit
MKPFKYIGRHLPSSDAMEKVTGTASFVTDIKVPNMLYGRFLRSPYAHARIKHVDASRALRIPGIKVVLTGDDSKANYGPFGGAIMDQTIVATEKVRYIGDPVAAVAAVDGSAAEEALSLIKVEYEELPAVLTVDEAIRPDSILIHEEIVPLPAYKHLFSPRMGTNICNHFKLRHGDVERGFGESDFVFEDEFTAKPVQHVPLEYHCSIARVNAGPWIEVITNTQTPSTLQEQLSRLFRIPQSHMRVTVPHVGGGFGSKQGPRLEPAAIALAWMAGRPVKMIIHREEEFLTVSRHGSRVIIKTGVKRDGTLMAREMRIYLDTGAYADYGPIVCKNVGYAAAGPYRIPHVRTDSYCVYTNKVPAGAMRGFGVPHVAWAYEQQIDMIAAKLRMDPMAIRKKNLLRNGDVFHTGSIVRDFSLDQTLDKVEKNIDWKRGAKGSTHGDSFGGKGIAMGFKSTATPSTSTADIKMNSDGSVSLICNTVDIGQGSRQILKQILAEGLGIPPETIIYPDPDTSVCPFDLGVFSSRATFHMGNAILLAVKDLQNQLLDSAAMILRVGRDQLEIVDGIIRVKDDPNRSVPLARAVIGTGTYRGSLRGYGTYQTEGFIDKETGQGEASFYWMDGSGGAEVEVDQENGATKVIKYIGVADAGKAINPVYVEQQIVGSIVMAIGQTFTEQMLYNEQGMVLNPSLLEYKVPTVKDLPKEIMGAYVEIPIPRGPFGAKGVAEINLVPVLPAVANAIFHATGIRVLDLPITPEKILEGLRKREK